MKAPAWFRSRGYQHFDVPVGLSYAESLSPTIVAAHSWSPLIHYIKEEPRYKPLLGKTVKKSRPIMYASHRDSCILSCYSHQLVALLDDWYVSAGLDETVIAYRSLGKSNYHFARNVENFVKSHTRITAMCFDVTGFFDNLQHRLLKERLCWALDCAELPPDWYSVFKFITRYHFVELQNLKSNSKFKSRIGTGCRAPIATVAELKGAGIPILGNANSFGIPQGTPISASFSNLYMSGFDEEMHAEAAKRGALYQRYSDDILIACEPTQGDELETLVEAMLLARGLQLQKNKTDRKTLAGQGALTFQYLGYQLGHCDARIRPGSLSRQWRTARRAVRKAEKAGSKAIVAGKATKIYVRKLHVRYNDARSRNFLVYAKRSAEVLESPAIKKQTKRLRRFIRNEMARLKRQNQKP